MYSGLEGAEFELLDGGTVQTGDSMTKAGSNCSFEQAGWELTQNKTLMSGLQGDTETAQMEYGLIDLRSNY